MTFHGTFVAQSNSAIRSSTRSFCLSAGALCWTKRNQMGELGRRLVRMDRASLLKELTRAYADEWFAHYNFQFTANAIWGHHSPSTTALLSRKSVEAFARANRLAQRILQLRH
jgi:hypothetical protein